MNRISDSVNNSGVISSVQSSYDDISSIGDDVSRIPFEKVWSGNVASALQRSVGSVVGSLRHVITQIATLRTALSLIQVYLAKKAELASLEARRYTVNEKGEIVEDPAVAETIAQLQQEIAQLNTEINSLLSSISIIPSLEIEV